MTRRLTLAVALSLLTAPAALAGQNVGNGGAIVAGTCDGTSASTQVKELLDFWEVNYRYGYSRDLGGPELTVEAKLDLVFQRLARLDPDRAALYRQWAGAFWTEEKDQDPRFPLPPLSDAGNITPNLPGGCTPTKVIEQVTPDSVLATKRYFVRRELFDVLDRDNQAGLILHELVYRDALTRGHKTSMKARIVTGVLASNTLDGFSPDQYEAFMVETGLIGYITNVMLFSGGVTRYFDHRLMTRAAAEAFCGNLAGDSRLALMIRDFDFNLSGQFAPDCRASAIGHRILGPDNSGRALIWNSNSQPVEIDNAGMSLQPPAPETLLPVLCWQETAASPWTALNN